MQCGVSAIQASAGADADQHGKSNTHKAVDMARLVNFDEFQQLLVRIAVHIFGADGQGSTHGTVGPLCPPPPPYTYV